MNNPILNGFKGSNIQEIQKGILNPNKLDSSKYDIFSESQIKNYLKSVVAKNTGMALEIQKSVVDSVRAEMSCLIPVNIVYCGKIKKFYVSKAGACEELNKAFEPVNKKEGYFDDNKGQVEEDDVLKFIDENEDVDDEMLIKQFGKEVTEILNSLEEDGKLDVNDDGYYFVTDENDNQEESQQNQEEEEQNQNQEEEEQNQNQKEEEEQNQEEEEQNQEEEEQNQNQEEDNTQNQKEQNNEGINKDGGGIQALMEEEPESQNQDQGEVQQNPEGEENQEGIQTQDNEEQNQEELQNQEEVQQQNQEEVQQNPEEEQNQEEVQQQNPEEEQNQEEVQQQNPEEEQNQEEVQQNLGEEQNQENNNDSVNMSPEELEAFAKKTATVTLLKFYKNSTDEKLKEIAAIELKRRGIEVDKNEEGKQGEGDLPENKAALDALESFTKDYLGKYDNEDLISVVVELANQDPGKRKELKDLYRSYYSMNNNGNKLLKVDEDEFKTFLTDHYFNNFTPGDLQSYAYLLISKNPKEYRRYKKMMDLANTPIV